ncbi:MAG: 3-hydroxyacyl-CoA dehydrogenase NAD-binding domain-containing protein [Calditrichia bacterium]
MKDVSTDALARGEKTVYDDLQVKVRRKIMSNFERDQIMSRIAGITEYAPFRGANLVIEAVFEDLGLKQKVLAETEAVTRDDCIFACATRRRYPSAKSPLKRNARSWFWACTIFRRVPKMPLLEIIVTDKTADWATATAVEAGIKQGKTVIVVKDTDFTPPEFSHRCSTKR